MLCIAGMGLGRGCQTIIIKNNAKNVNILLNIKYRLDS